MELEVRPGRPEDLAQIVEIYNHYVERSATSFEVARVRPEDRAPWLEQHRGGGRHRLLVAVEGSRIVGWATTSSFRPRAAYETTVEASVYCAPDRRGHGIGSRLYRALFQSIESEDVERIVAGVTLPNPASVRLHRRFGFRRVGVFHRVGRKFGRYWDVAWFERPLRKSAPASRSTARASRARAKRRASV
jgi:phosphinothricin acetyltransferase